MVEEKKIILNDYSNFEEKPAKIRAFGKQFKKYVFKGNFERKSIKDFVEQIAKRKKESGIKGRISVSLKYPEGYMGGVVKNYGEPVNLYSYANSVSDAVTGPTEDPKIYKEFIIHITDFMDV